MNRNIKEVIIYNNLQVNVKEIKYDGATYFDILGNLNTSKNDGRHYIEFPYPLYNSFLQEKCSFIWLSDDKLETLILGQ